MADDDNEDFDGTNMDGKMVVDETIIKLAEQYAASLRRSSNENDTRAEIRANAKKIGIPTKAFQQGVSMVKLMDVGERREHQRGLKRMLTVLGDKVADLFPDDVARQQARAKRRAEAAAKAAAAAGKETPEQQERRLAADANPRNNPASGGAGKKRGRKSVAESVADRAEALSGAKPEDEQSEGERVLAAGLSETTKSQSQLAQERLVEAGLAK